jgi:hypothetical protein
MPAWMNLFRRSCWVLQMLRDKSLDKDFVAPLSFESSIAVARASDAPNPKPFSTSLVV